MLFRNTIALMTADDWIPHTFLLDQTERRGRKRLLAAVGVLALAASAPAQVDPGVVYALITDGTAAPVTPSIRQNVGGGTVTSVRTGTGTYAATFAGTTVTGWSVMADAWGQSNSYCQAVTTNSTPAGEIDVS